MPVESTFQVGADPCVDVGEVGVEDGLQSPFHCPFGVSSWVGVPLG